MRVLLVVEDKTSFRVNCPFDKAVIGGAIKRQTYDLIIGLLFAEKSGKLTSMNIIDLTISKKAEPELFSTNDCEIDSDLYHEFELLIGSYGIKKADFICGTKGSELAIIKNTIPNLDLVDPYVLLDKDLFDK